MSQEYTDEELVRSYLGFLLSKYEENKHILHERKEGVRFVDSTLQSIMSIADPYQATRVLGQIVNHSGTIHYKTEAGEQRTAQVPDEVLAAAKQAASSVLNILSKRASSS